MFQVRRIRQGKDEHNGARAHEPNVHVVSGASDHEGNPQGEPLPDRDEAIASDEALVALTPRHRDTLAQSLP